MVSIALFRFMSSRICSSFCSIWLLNLFTSISSSAKAGSVLHSVVFSNCCPWGTFRFAVEAVLRLVSTPEWCLPAVGVTLATAELKYFRFGEDYFYAERCPCLVLVCRLWESFSVRQFYLRWFSSPLRFCISKIVRYLASTSFYDLPISSLRMINCSFLIFKSFSCSLCNKSSTSFSCCVSR